MADKTICRALSAKNNEHGPWPLNSLAENLTSKQTPFFWAVDVVMQSICLVYKKPGTIDQVVSPALRKWKQKVHKFKVILSYLVSLNLSWTTFNLSIIKKKKILKDHHPSRVLSE